MYHLFTTRCTFKVGGRPTCGHLNIYLYCITRYFRGRTFSRKVNLRYFREKIFSRIILFTRTFLTAKISSCENYFSRKYLPAKIVSPKYVFYVPILYTYLLRSISDRSSWRLCACAGRGAGTAGRGSVGNFSLSICLSWSPGAYGAMVLGAVRAWLLGRAMANLLNQCCKHEVYKNNSRNMFVAIPLVHVIFLSTWYIYTYVCVLQWI